MSGAAVMLGYLPPFFLHLEFHHQDVIADWRQEVVWLRQTIVCIYG